MRARGQADADRALVPPPQLPRSAASASDTSGSRRRKRRLLDVPHFHCVFTLPHEYHGLWRYNQKWFVTTFFDVVRSSLMDSLGEEKRHGITPGILMAMHTWGRQLTLHPHIHCVVSGGGLDAQGKWKETAAFCYRGDRSARSIEDGSRRGSRKRWSPANWNSRRTRILPAFAAPTAGRTTSPGACGSSRAYAHGNGVLIYLARYLRGGAIHPKQIRRCDGDGIGFVYKDHRDGRRKLLTLAPREFIRRLLQHVPETGQHMIRHYGLYAGACREKRNACRGEVGGLIERTASEGVVDPTAGPKTPICRGCGHPLRLRWTQNAAPRKANSYRIERRVRDVQQQDEPVTAAAKKPSSPLRLWHFFGRRVHVISTFCPAEVLRVRVPLFLDSSRRTVGCP